MLQLLRAVYPQGCLITEIVSVEGGNYLIRALVQVEGVTIVTGFAVSSDLEIAQDKALERVLKILGIKVHQVEEFSSPTSFPIVENGQNLSSLNHNLEELTPVEASASLSFKNLATSDLGSAKSRSESSLPKVDLDPPTIAEVSDLVIDNPPIEPSTATLVTPSLDRSQLQTQALVEMERLGWTRKQGVEYLSTKYGKKMRSELTDAELIDFWTYLQSLSLPENS
ncbi:hypothetical protein [Merismopedia glauca]|uniref:Uncharacterized protein n=1 Tax=Merismopedia glauca CCAP 1448/3 TaxID=1296344 RepID=A0A2T1BYS9_9CYAN|nr:hypothetical protein [Merismopedia glauca]PSB01067.1 hypothetical protein C7B64_20300 [Merismopedia glauca CCAP 1448/3]